VHLHDIIDRADLFKNRHILLTHFSMRYGEGKIVDTLKKTLPKPLRGRLSALLADGRIVGPFE
ncbi:MAG TPA: MBL fold metallo-hydrolase, partial [Myxococcota bacterium]|nr:MBL fold metallo-hydrolase [Myxococcota bacterium]